MSNYNEYKQYLERFGQSTTRPYTPRYRDIMELLHYVPYFDLEKDKQNIHRNIFKSLGFFHESDISATEKTKVLLRLKRNLKHLTEMIDDAIDIELKACEVSENSDERFINQFNDIDSYPKKQLAELCGRSETWIHGWKKENVFNEDFNGVYLKSFLTWLSQEKPKQFMEFKKNWKNKNK